MLLTAGSRAGLRIFLFLLDTIHACFIVWACGLVASFLGWVLGWDFVLDALSVLLGLSFAKSANKRVAYANRLAFQIKTRQSGNYTASSMCFHATKTRDAGQLSCYLGHGIDEACKPIEELHSPLVPL